VLRPRVLIALGVASAGLAAALWLPTRFDSADAAVLGRHGGHYGGQFGGRGGQLGGRGGPGHRHGPAPTAAPTATAPPTTTPPTTAPPTTTPPTTTPPTTTPPTTAPPTTTPPTTTPPTTRPPTSPPPRRTTPPTTTPPASPVATPWRPFTLIRQGQLVTYGGVTYRAEQTHTSLPGWEPPKVPQLFTPV
jgi:hypothetical protein